MVVKVGGLGLIAASGRALQQSRNRLAVSVPRVNTVSS